MKRQARIRRYHPWWKWECYAAGFYAAQLPGVSSDTCIDRFKSVFTSGDFDAAAKFVLANWRHSCEQFLLNEHINRIAWIGQAAVCWKTGVPSRFKFAFMQLTSNQQYEANCIAAWHLRQWLEGFDNGDWDARTRCGVSQGMAVQGVFRWDS